MMHLDLKIDLIERRCADCHRWFASESTTMWCCGSCQRDLNEKLQQRITELLRSNAALRGALRKAKE